MKTKALLLMGFLYLSSNLQAQLFTLNTSNLPTNSTDPSSMDILSADVDDDGDLDIIIAMEFVANVLLFNDGNGVFTIDPDRTFPEYNVNDQFTGEDSEDIGLADFDQDGDLDVLFVSEDSPFHELLWNDGTGQFTFASYQFPGSTANALAIIDFNGDEYPDVLIGNNGQNQAYINDTDGTFSPAPSDLFPSNTDQTQDLKLVDIDLDNDLDIVEGIELGGNNIYINNGSTFEMANDRLPDFQATLETRKMVVGDIDSDNDPDLFLCNVGWVPGANMQNRLLLNDGNGYFEDASDLIPFSLEFTLDALIQDINDDGHNDLVTTGLGNPGSTYHVYLNDGTNNFTEATAEVFPIMFFSGGIGLHSADFNMDDALDIYFSNHGEGDQLCFKATSVNTKDKLAVVSISLSPNPVNDSLLVQFPDRISSGNASFEIISIDGKQIAKWEEAIGNSEASVPVNIAQLSKGEYLLHIRTKNQNYIGRFLKG